MTILENLNALNTYADEDGSIPPTKEVIKYINDEIIPELINNNIIPHRISPTVEEGVCLTFKKDNIDIYVEFYNDGDIALVSSDRIKKCIIESMDLNRDNILENIVKYYTAE